ncbi:MAG TPA: protealysin inhibitor emfourin [Pseudonocardia sp.]|jgi:hypothetical protein|uniref:protealysin inhibitor emfourin n=1 Tax=Pseudonocardia sp. TaxID=60912 RepID=UPI002F411F37
MRVRIVRRGGFAGVALEATIDTAELGEPDAASVESQLRTLPWGQSAAVPSHPDQFSYELTTLGEPEAPSAVLREDQLSPPLARLFDERKSVRRTRG